MNPDQQDLRLSEQFRTKRLKFRYPRRGCYLPLLHGSTLLHFRLSPNELDERSVLLGGNRDLQSLKSNSC